MPQAPSSRWSPGPGAPRTWWRSRNDTAAGGRKEEGVAGLGFRRWERAGKLTHECLTRRKPTTSPPRLQQFNTAASASARYDPRAPRGDVTTLPRLLPGRRDCRANRVPAAHEARPTPNIYWRVRTWGRGMSAAPSEGRLIGDRRESPPFCHVPEPDVRKVRASVKVRPRVGGCWAASSWCLIFLLRGREFPASKVKHKSSLLGGRATL